MKNLDRRNFLKSTIAIGAGSLCVSSKAKAEGAKNILSPDRLGVLVDTTVCVGCRNCEWACKDSHNLPNESIEKYADRSVFKEQRRPNEKAFTVVNEYANYKNPLLPYDVKVQCMHCDKPACVSACIVGALSKQENGAVVWDSEKCIGCRYCMIACPFQIPTFDYDVALKPDIKKCDFCANRQKDSKLPACVDICPVEALTFGTRTELIKIARERIKRHPDRYVKYLFGENEVGGTSWMYLAGTNIYELGFPKLPQNTAPGVSEAIQHGIFSYFIPPVMFYALLGGVMWMTKKRQEIFKEDE